MDIGSPIGSIYDMFNISTTTKTNLASVATQSLFKVTATGTVGIASSSPFAILSIGTATSTQTRPFFQIASSTQTTRLYTIDYLGRHYTSSTPPTVSLCGTTPSIVGSDYAGKVITGTGAPQSCTVTFSQKYSSSTSCMIAMSPAQGFGTSSVVTSSSTATQFSFMAASSSQYVGMTTWTASYQCIGLGAP
jgi:hypothetical protein